MTSLFDILLLAIALAMDCFTVSIVSGVIVRQRISAPRKGLNIVDGRKVFVK